ncbi:neutral zinc metallopeptidase [Microbacterium sp. NIBRBAC000506063]|uniref:KPN_02809 family neutral zinc metallopeptidase n=1 Tax=Microbacterium sp. NIBRBAC000506063 TaxID=2734618 RepID=UPI001BB69C50|nr:neutral zinc metallopeptidase [Microbacterium sp. NIBRBAC000506063]QTV80209.1 neutral zinc metallopeptidase [Microbacterium sp. NIBRBAC000506063]
MTFNPNADVSGNKARHRGRNTAIAGGGVIGLGAIVVLLMNMFGFGQFTPLVEGILGEGQQGQELPASEIAQCETGADANADDGCRIAAASLAIDQFWEENVTGYRPPTLTVVAGSTSTPCGTASNAVGPFYCPADEGVYVDPTFFALLRQQFGASAGELSQLYVLAHEYGHHIQNITGTMREYPNNGTGPSSNGVRMELQADCYAGAWVGAMTEQLDPNGVPYLEAPTEPQIADALNAAATVGDDHIQSQSGMVNPESWTHGSSSQREYWFATGYQYGLAQCDTFAVPAGDL